MDSEIHIIESKRPQHEHDGRFYGDNSIDAAYLSQPQQHKQSSSSQQLYPEADHPQAQQQSQGHYEEGQKHSMWWCCKSKNSNQLVQPHEIPLYIQRSTFKFEDFIYFFTNTEPPRFHFPKPSKLQQHRLSDDAWAALQLRVDHISRDLLDPHRYYAAALYVGLFMTIVFYAVRPGYDRNTIHASSTKNGSGSGGDENRNYIDDDELYDDYIHDDLWERNHSMDDVVLAELNYLNSNLDTSLWMWRISLLFSLLLLFGCVIFLVVLMERRNCVIDDKIRQAIDEIRSRFEDEGIGVEYRTTSSPTLLSLESSSSSLSPSLPSSLPFWTSCAVMLTSVKELFGKIFFWGKYIRPTRVVVFYHITDDTFPRSSSQASSSSLECKGMGGGERKKKTNSFFSEDYQRKYFPPRSVDENSSVGVTTTTTSPMPLTATAFSFV